MILIFGAPRSGTSWLGKIFDSHPNTLYRAEPDKELRNSQIPFLCSEDDVSKFQEATARYTQTLLDVHNSNALGSPPFMRKAYHNDFENVLRKSLIFTVKSLGRIKGLSGPFGKMSVPDLADYINDATIEPVIKSVGSMGRVGLFLAALPNAKIVIIVRHPCGHIASVISGRESRHLGQKAALNGLGETRPAKERGIDQATLDGMPVVEQLAWRWMVLNELAIQQAEGNPNAMVLKYEDLCAEPDAVSRRIFEFSGLPWTQQTEDFVAASTASSNKSGSGYFSVNRDPLISAMKWRQKMDPADIATIRDVVAGSLPGKLFEGEFV